MRFLVDMAVTAEFQSKDAPDQWVRWEFRTILVRPTHYTIQSSKDNSLKSWLVEGSKDGESWTTIDEQKRDSHLKEDFAVHSFDVKSEFECRFVRLTQTGKNHADSNRLEFCSLELFGSIRLLPPRDEIELPLKEPSSLSGIISYLTRNYGGNVQDKGIVTIISKSSTFGYAVGNVADLTSDAYFRSGDKPGQWVCWDFHEMRIRPTHYTIRSSELKSWLIESSLDGETWTAIDRKIANKDFKADEWRTASFVVSKSTECRFIRLTQTGDNQSGYYYLSIGAFEVFGTLIQ
jgi:hypothetical protein